MEQTEFMRRLHAIPEDAPDRIDLAMIKGMDQNDATAVPLEDFKKSDTYSGKLFVRIPKTLHQELAAEAKENGVSLNQYVLYKLAR